MKEKVLSNLVIKKVISVSTLYSPKKTKWKKNNRPYWAIIYKHEGETVYSSNDKTFIGDPNHIVILPKGCNYNLECTKSGYYSIIELESDNTYQEPIPFSIKNGEKLLKLIKEMEYKRNLKGSMYEIESIKDAYLIILMLFNLSTDKYVPNSKKQKIQPALDYISQNYTKNITNDTLANLSKISTVYFRKLFTSVMGISPIAYTKQLRIEKAKEILKSDYSSLSDVALSLGYLNLFDFSRDFKKHTGISPSRY